MIKSVIIVLTSLIAVNSLAQFRTSPPVSSFPKPPSSVFGEYPKLAQSTYGGSGCPDGSVSITFAPDNSAISILFDQFTVQTNNPREVSVKDCTLIIPVPVPKGMNARVVGLDYRGYRSLPQKARLDITAYHALSDWLSGNFLSHLHMYTDAAGGPKEGEIAFSASAVNSPSDLVPCGKAFNLHIKSQLVLNSQASQGTALATLDSVDAVTRGQVVYRLAWHRCGLL